MVGRQAGTGGASKKTHPPSVRYCYILEPYILYFGVDFMNIPNKVKIGGLEYNVSFADNLMRDNSANGQSCGNQQTILIDSSASNQLKESTFIHEILHQLSYVYHLDLDEDAVSRMEGAVYAFLKDNPDILASK